MQNRLYMNHTLLFYFLHIMLTRTGSLFFTKSHRGILSLIFAFSLILSFIFMFLMSQTARAEEAVFQISDYAASSTIPGTSQRWRGYVFQVAEDTVVTHLVGGGGTLAGTGGNPNFMVGVYAIDKD